MLQAFIGKKRTQTQMFTADGMRIPVTEITAEPCVITQIKTVDKDGYWALQLGIDQQMVKNITKPLAGHLKKTGKGNFAPRFLMELGFIPDATGQVSYKVGDEITAEHIFQVGDKIKVTGIGKAKGFAGGVKRHGFAGGPRTHGQSDRERAPGSIGQTTTPGRVYKGKRMAGRMGGEKVTIRGLKIVAIDTQKHTLTIKGVVPGNKNRPVIIQKQ